MVHYCKKIVWSKSGSVEYFFEQLKTITVYWGGLLGPKISTSFILLSVKNNATLQLIETYA